VLCEGKALAINGAELRVVLCLDAKISLYAVRRDRMAYDSRFIPPSSSTHGTGSVVYLLLRGTLVWQNPHESFVGPHLLVLPRALLDGSAGVRQRTFHNYGEPLDVCTVFFDADPPAETIERIVPPLAAWEELQRSFEALVQSSHRSDRASAARAILDTLVDVRALPGSCVMGGTATKQPSNGVLSRTWAAFADTWSGGALPSLTEMAERTATSTRQVQRDLGAMADALSLPFRGWRATLLSWRITLAVTLLGAPRTTVGEVAARVGYGSTAAMARAFRDAGVPPPTEIRAALLAINASSGAATG
jgi:AraC-like DNA-binding protein